MPEGRFPQSRRIGKVAMARLENEVEDWIRARAIAVKTCGWTRNMVRGRGGY